MDRPSLTRPISNPTMRETTVLLQVLGHHVVHAKLGGVPIKDVIDFRAWLLQCSRKADFSTGMEDFLKQLE